MDKAELIITALQQRIGEIVSNYETQIAILRADFTNISEVSKQQQESIDDYAQVLEKKFIDEENYRAERESLRTRIIELEKNDESIQKTTTKSPKKV